MMLMMNYKKITAQNQKSGTEKLQPEEAELTSMSIQEIHVTSMEIQVRKYLARVFLY